MTAPELSATSSALSDIAVDVLVVGVVKGEDGPRVLHDDPAVADLDLEAIGIGGGADEVRRIPFAGAARSLALVGFGTAAPGPVELRYAAGSAVRQLTGIESVALALPADDDEAVTAIAEGAAIGSWAFTQYRTTSLASTRTPASRIQIVVPDADAASSAIDRGRVIAEAVLRVKDLVTTPASDLYPETFAAAAVSAAEGLGIETTVLDETELAAGGYGGILAVGQGSVRPPRMVRLDWAPEGAARHLALVGKGITFDTGGLQLKPPVGMLGMKYDMTGAASVLAVVVAAAALQLPVRVTAFLCIAENMPSGSAMRPNDVFTTRGGMTVENMNSDAEGRLVMADGLADASALQPDAIVDIATLTGAARVALGGRYVGLMGDTDLTGRITSLGQAAGEPFWAMPLPGELRALLNSEVADIANAKPGNTAGGMLLAGTFLQEFVGTREDGVRIPWAHLDIAGPANNDGGGFGYTGKGSTGIAVRTLIALAESLSES